jgi:two-component system, OmpR family, KDP operon response regulator KdpE
MSGNSAVVLLIDDEIQIRRLLRLALESVDYRVYEAENGQQGLSEVAYRRPDVILLDLGLPDLDGLAVLQRLREWSQIPVLVLSVREGPEDKIAALDRGADDYLTKPFDTGELLARMRALLRRTQAGDEAPILTFGELELDLAAHVIKVHQQELKLTPTEYALLKHLAVHADKVVTQRQLLREIWGPQAEEQAQYLRVYLTHLRKKLATAGLTSVEIRTEKGIGYRFIS